MGRRAGSVDKSRNWDFTDGSAVEEIERLNSLSQRCVAASLVKFLLAKSKTSRDKIASMPNETALAELHRAGTIFLLDNPGCYRHSDVHLRARDGKFIRQAPPPQLIQKLMREFFRKLAVLWAKGDALDVAAYAAWRIGWIHPFRDGNGRTARQFAYVCLCVKLGEFLPDTNTVVDQICVDQTRWVKLLLAANRAYERGKPDLRAVKLYLDSLLLRQIRDAEMLRDREHAETTSAAS